MSNLLKIGSSALELFQSFRHVDRRTEGVILTGVPQDGERALKRDKKNFRFDICVFVIVAVEFRQDDKESKCVLKTVLRDCRLHDTLA
jgi:hypothetical protein